MLDKITPHFLVASKTIILNFSVVSRYPTPWYFHPSLFGILFFIAFSLPPFHFFPELFYSFFTFLPSFLPSFIFSFLPSFLPFFPSLIPSFLPPPFPLFFPPQFLLSFLSSFIPLSFPPWFPLSFPHSLPPYSLVLSFLSFVPPLHSSMLPSLFPFPSLIHSFFPLFPLSFLHSSSLSFLPSFIPLFFFSSFAFLSCLKRNKNDPSLSGDWFIPLFLSFLLDSFFPSSPFLLFFPPSFIHSFLPSLLQNFDHFSLS